MSVAIRQCAGQQGRTSAFMRSLLCMPVPPSTSSNVVGGDFRRHPSAAGRWFDIHLCRGARPPCLVHADALCKSGGGELPTRTSTPEAPAHHHHQRTTKNVVEKNAAFPIPRPTARTAPSSCLEEPNRCLTWTLRILRTLYIARSNCMQRILPFSYKCASVHTTTHDEGITGPPLPKPPSSAHKSSTPHGCHGAL